MNVYKFYNEEGWSQSEKNTKDAILFEDLRPVAKIMFHIAGIK